MASLLWQVHIYLVAYFRDEVKLLTADIPNLFKLNKSVCLAAQKRYCQTGACPCLPISTEGQREMLRSQSVSLLQSDLT